MEYLALGVIALGVCCLAGIALFELDRLNTTMRFIEEEIRYMNDRIDGNIENSNKTNSKGTIHHTVYPSNDSIIKSGEISGNDFMKMMGYGKGE